MSIALLLLAALTGCGADEAAPPKAAPAPKAAQAAPAEAAPAGAARVGGTTCRVTQAGGERTEGPCTFTAEGKDGSFRVSRPGGFGGIDPITVSMVEPGTAEVSGLTADGVVSRWGPAHRSQADKACWGGSDFEVCAWAGDKPEAAAASKAVAQVQGGTYWAVYAATGANGNDPKMKAATEALKDQGLEFGVTMGVGTLGCDGGAAAALGLPEGDLGVAAYFASEADAQAFAAGLPTRAAGVARITAMCRD